MDFSRLTTLFEAWPGDENGGFLRTSLTFLGVFLLFLELFFLLVLAMLKKQNKKE